jgi:predicted GIY-YIG superfamily endonuclease
MKAVYRRMLRRMQEKALVARDPGSEEPWFLYVVECRDKSLYTGVTKDLDRRLAEHNAGRASRYTRTRLPVTLRYHERCADRTTALVRECAVKALSREGKEALIAGQAGPEARPPRRP